MFNNKGSHEILLSIFLSFIDVIFFSYLFLFFVKLIHIL